MKHRRVLFPLIGAVFAIGTALAACGLTTSGIMTESDASAESASDTSSDPRDETLTDASGEGSIDDAADAGTTDAGLDASDTGMDASTGPIVCVTVPTGVTNCASCPGYPSLCPAIGRCVSSCHDQCDGGPIECFACGAAIPAIISTCAAIGVGTCPATTPYGPCPCPGSVVALCPGDAQVCASNLCIACGESSSDGKSCHSQSCKAGGGDNPKYTCY